MESTGPGERWLQSTPFLDLDHPALWIRARALTQLCNSDRDKARVLHDFVQRIAFADPFSADLKAPAEVLRGRGAEAQAKAGLLVALLRLNGIASRIRYVILHGVALRGLVDGCGSFARPVLEILIDGHWLQTDTFIFDRQYLDAARAQLDQRQWLSGFGISRTATGLWNGTESAFLSGKPLNQDPLVVADHGPFDDPQAWRQRVTSDDLMADWSRSAAIARGLHWHFLQRRARAGLHALRASLAGPVPAWSQR